MLPDDTRSKIENIVAGVVLEGSADHCTTIRNLLCSRFATSTVVKADFESNTIIKEKQAKLIEDYCTDQGLFLQYAPSDDQYLTRGGEAKIYLDRGGRHVLKLNDGIYYATWLEYLNSVLLHNLLFPNTSYQLLGFLKQEDTLYAVVKQAFVVANAPAELSDIKNVLQFNGFVNVRRNDYLNAEMGLILEDMHDENVLMNADILFFIDSVFYTIAPHK